MAAELVHRLGDAATVLSGHCLSYGQGAAFWPIREALAEAAGGDTSDAVRGLLGDADDAELVAGVVSATLGSRRPAQSGASRCPGRSAGCWRSWRGGVRCCS